MGKRLWKNVILVCCVLALVFQPVNCYATLEYTGAIGYNCVPYAQAPSDILDFIDGDYNNLPAAFSVTNKNFVIQYNSLGGNLYLYVSNATNDELLLFSQTTNNNTNLNFYRKYNGAFQAVTVSCYSYSTVSASLPTASTRNNLYTNNPNNLWYLVLSPTAVNQANESLFIEVQSSGGSGGTNDPDDWPIDPGTYTYVYDPNIYFQLGLMFSTNFNCYTPDGSTHFNSGWLGVGQVLTYDYLCKTHKNQQNVTITLADGSTASVANYLYSTDSATLSNIADTLNLCYTRLGTINTNTSNTATRLNTTNTRLLTISNKLVEAFPSDQAELNDDIAEELLDDTNGTGLTVSKVTDAKSSLDNGINLFSLDTSSAQYSDPFEAIDGADWSFWSQTTLNNLGSGYTFTYSGGELMSGSEEFTDNQNTLKSLLGW